MSRADRSLPHGFFTLDAPGYDRLKLDRFPYYRTASPTSVANCAKCDRLLAAVVVAPQGLALVVWGASDVDPEQVRIARERAGRVADRAMPASLWGEWLDGLTDTTPATGWCPRHRAQQVDVERLVRTVRHGRP